MQYQKFAENETVKMTIIFYSSLTVFILWDAAIKLVVWDLNRARERSILI